VKGRDASKVLGTREVKSEKMFVYQDPVSAVEVTNGVFDNSDCADEGGHLEGSEEASGGRNDQKGNKNTRSEN
jgi:hypothetical protein